MLCAIAFCVLAGAVTTTGVAVFCASRPACTEGSTLFSMAAGEGTVWSYTIEQGAGAVEIWRSASVYRGPVEIPVSAPRWSRLHSPPNDAEAQAGGSWRERAVGWPTLAAVIETRSDRGAPQISGMRLLWTGVIANSLVFGFVWLAFICVPPAARRGWRRWRGACSGCGYDLRYTPDSTRCPECGGFSFITRRPS